MTKAEAGAGARAGAGMEWVKGQEGQGPAGSGANKDRGMNGSRSRSRGREREQGTMWGQSSAAKQKIRPRNLKIRLLSDHIFTKNQTKSRPKLAILR